MILVITHNGATAEWNDEAGFVGDDELVSTLNLLSYGFSRIGVNVIQQIVDVAPSWNFVVTAYEPDTTELGLLDGI